MSDISTKNVGRNDDCPCGKINPNTGNPMKFKKCCLSNRLMMDLNISEFVMNGHIRDVDKDVLYRVSYKNLGGDLPERIDKWLETNLITKQDCWFNSHALALSKDFDELEVVNGWYGWKTKEDIIVSGVSNEKELQDYYLRRYDPIQIGDTDWYRFQSKGEDPDNNDLLYKLDSGVFWHRHSWNIGKGMSRKFEGQDVHFDLTIELNEKYKGIWTDYDMVETSHNHPEIPNYISEMKSRPNLITKWIKSLDRVRTETAVSHRGGLNKEVYKLDVEREYEKLLREKLYNDYKIKSRLKIADYDLDKIIEERTNWVKSGKDPEDFPVPNFTFKRSGNEKEVYKIELGGKVIMEKPIPEGYVSEKDMKRDDKPFTNLMDDDEE